MSSEALAHDGLLAYGQARPAYGEPAAAVVAADNVEELFDRGKNFVFWGPIGLAAGVRRLRASPRGVGGRAELDRRPFRVERSQPLPSNPRRR